MRTMRKILKALVLSVAGLLLVVIALAAAIWVKPDLLLNEKRVKQALRFAPAGTEVSWDSFSWTFESEGLWGKKSELALTKLCFQLGETWSGCAPELRIDLSISLRGFHPHITR